MLFGFPVVPDENIIYNGWSNGSCSNDISVSDRSINSSHRIALDSFIVSQGGSPALRMEVDDKPEELTETHKEFIEAVKNNSGPQWKVGSISRQNFYEEAKKAYCIVTTTDARPFGCFIITKGVILPDGKVWS